MLQKQKEKQETVKIKVDKAPSSRRKTKKVLVEFILDETGSMEQFRDDVIGGYNTYVEDQRKAPGKCYFSFTKFNSGRIDNILERSDIDNVMRIDRYSYRPGGSTNLYDAIGQRLSRLLRDRDQLRDTSVMVVVFTDGYENSSREFKYDDVRDLIRRCEAEGWSFIYMGANQDAWKVGEGLGVSNIYNTSTFDMRHTGETFRKLSTATMDYCSNVAVGADVSARSYNFFADDAAKDGIFANNTIQSVQPTFTINGDVTVNGKVKVKEKA